MSEFGKNLGNAALGIATGGIGTAVNAGLGLVFGDKADKKAKERQFEQQKKLQELQLKGQKELNTQGFDLSKRMWDETNYGAQLGHMKDAGLSPGLMYGQAGAGGSTQSGSGGSVTGGSASSDMSGVGMGLQLAMMNAQKENIEADTEQKRAATENTGADTVIKGLDAEWKKIDNRIKGATAADAIDMVRAEIQRRNEEIIALKHRNGVNMNTYLEQITEVKANAAGSVLRNKAITKGLELSDAQMNKMSQDIAQGWTKLGLDKRGLDQNDERIKIERYNKEMQAKYPSMWNVVGKAMIDSFNGLGVPDYDNSIK